MIVNPSCVTHESLDEVSLVCLEEYERIWYVQSIFWNFSRHLRNTGGKAAKTEPRCSEKEKKERNNQFIFWRKIKSKAFRLLLSSPNTLGHVQRWNTPFWRTPSARVFDVHVWLTHADGSFVVRLRYAQWNPRWWFPPWCFNAWKYSPQRRQPTTRWTWWV